MRDNMSLNHKWLRIIMPLKKQTNADWETENNTKEFGTKTKA